MDGIFSSFFVWVLSHAEKLIHNLNFHQVMIIVIFGLSSIWTFLFFFRKRALNDNKAIKSTLDETHNLNKSTKEVVDKLKEILSSLETKTNLIDVSVKDIKDTIEALRKQTYDLETRLVKSDARIGQFEKSLDGLEDLLSNLLTKLQLIEKEIDKDFSFIKDLINTIIGVGNKRLK